MTASFAVGSGAAIFSPEDVGSSATGNAWEESLETPVGFSDPIPYRRISKHLPALKASSCFIHLPDQRLGYGKNREKTHGKSPSFSIVSPGSLLLQKADTSASLSSPFSSASRHGFLVNKNQVKMIRS